MEKSFREFFVKFPMEFSELYVIKQIHKSLECAEKAYKDDKTSPEYLKYMTKAAHQLHHYFLEKGIDPSTHPY